MELLTLKNIKKTYGKKAQVTALNHFSLVVEPGEMIAVMGKSGAGKSTVLNIISGIDRADEGQYFFDGREVSHLMGDKMTLFRRENIGFVLQHFGLIDDMIAFDNIAVPLRLRHLSRKEIREQVSEVAKRMGLEEKLNKYPKELSGGEAQRVAIARAIVHKPRLLLADEPTGALDEENSLKIMDIFRELNRAGMTLLIVTHDTGVADMCKRTIWMKDGRNYRR